VGIKTVIFDWRGTLVRTLTPHEWVTLALAHVGMPSGAVRDVLAAIDAANGPEDRLDGPGVDSDVNVHRRTFMHVFADARLDPDLAEALYAVESDPRNNPFAVDAPDALRALNAAGVRIAVLSDIHFDLRPAFADVGLLEHIDTFMLSYEQGIQKPNPLMFTRTLEALRVDPTECLMVGDRSHPDGPAVEQGITTLLVPPLRDVGERRLHHVLSLCGIGNGHRQGRAGLGG
jgi:FMN phosphatase YigB (HAD superfamily)